ncbi:hypothetical protein FA15DRAFT_51804 [Coprinopsis marcescibilis]|uniref:Uncharacterized protein n=1 Tax=Coprinopsis marcescibilis TaxID=230819 RepID=A0A5C3KNM3_COPMA|nr:hypothetical protein FA15DRAFT_51804 [Coprinopsis marcescibilis]
MIYAPTSSLAFALSNNSEALRFIIPMFAGPYKPASYSYYGKSYRELPEEARQVLIDHGVLERNICSFTEPMIHNILVEHLHSFGSSIERSQKRIIRARMGLSKLSDEMIALSEGMALAERPVMDDYQRQANRFKRAKTRRKRICNVG